MRKLKGFLAALCVIALLLSGEALAGDKIATSGGWIKDFKELERQLQYYADECVEKFSLEFYDTVVMKINNDPKCFVETIEQNGIFTFGFEEKASGSRHRIEFVMEYYPGKKCAYAYASGNTDILSEDEKQLLDRALEIASAVDGSGEEAIKQIHDHICDNVSYRHGEHDDIFWHSALGALLEGEAVCDGYADAFYLLCCLKGIEVTYVPGEALSANERLNADPYDNYNHMWNAVRLDEKWYMIDVEFGDTEPGTTYVSYLLGTDMMDDSYSWSAVFPVKMSKEPYARSENPLIEVTNWREAETEIMRAYRKRLDRVTLVGLDFEKGSLQLSRILASPALTYVNVFPTRNCCEIVFK
ncbi:MAG: hypothetical protein IKI24_05155 [Clostridia bacterium]|nr:hypothetical protein [Clostridia bacterium]